MIENMRQPLRKEFVMKTLCASLLFCLLFQIGPVNADETHITIYNKDLGLVKQVRDFTIQPGERSLHFTDVAAKLIPTSVHLRSSGDSGPIQVLEQNFEYDLVDSKKILQKYIDHPVEIVRKNGDLIKGILLSTQGGSLVVKVEDTISIIPWNNEMSIHVEELPEGLITRPTLIWELAGSAGGEKKLEVSYLTRGMDWQADYVAVINEKSTLMNLKAWVSINNKCGATFKDSYLKLVAGEVHRAPEPRAPLVMAKKTMEKTAAPGFKEREFFEYHIYGLDRITTLKNNQIKQIALFAPVEVVSEKKYVYNAWQDNKRVTVRLLFANDQKSGLGKPLPAGTFRIYQRDRENLEFIGEDRIDHTPRNVDVHITVGKAFDLSGERRAVSRKKVSKRAERQTVEIELKNNKQTESVTIVVDERLSFPNWEMETTSFPYEKKDAHRVEFDVPVQAGETSKLTYTVLYSW